MKTIKGASGSISKFLHFAKFPALMVLMIFGILIGGSERPRPTLPVEVTQSELKSTRIKAPFVEVAKDRSEHLAGRMEKPQSKSDLPNFYCGSSSTEIGGNGTPRTNTNNPTIPSPNSRHFDIGGQSTPRTNPRPYDNWSENYKS